MFSCVGDDGNNYTVIEYTDIIESRALSGSISRIRGMKTLMTSSGHHVNFRSDDEYEVVVTGVKLKRV